MDLTKPGKSSTLLPNTRAKNKMIETRLRLLYKIPMIIFTCGALYFYKRARAKQTSLFMKDLYLNIDT